MIETVKMIVWCIRLVVGMTLLDLYRTSVENVPIWFGQTPEEIDLKIENKRLREELVQARASKDSS